MKQVSSMSELFERLNDLKIVFRYGQKMIPIIQSLIDFMKDTVPLLEDINTSISDTTNKIPKAKDQINNVSSQTELATTEILDIVDSISDDVEKFDKYIKEIKNKEEEKKKTWEAIKNLIPHSSESEKYINHFESLDIFYSVLPSMEAIFNKIRDDVYKITLSLQVQDITSQQLAAVNHLIESVRLKLSSLIIHLDETDLTSIENVKLDIPVGSTFDPDAVYTKSTERQEAADLLINSINNKATQDEIDKLFS